MDEQEERIAELQSKTQRSHYEFIQAELDACFTAVQVGIHELESGHREGAQEESQKAEKGYKTVIGFVAELGDEQQKTEIEKRWNDLRAKLDALQSMLKDKDKDTARNDI
jgi:hypothetical protein